MGNTYTYTTRESWERAQNSGPWNKKIPKELKGEKKLISLSLSLSSRGNRVYHCFFFHLPAVVLASSFASSSFGIVVGTYIFFFLSFAAAAFSYLSFYLSGSIERSLWLSANFFKPCFLLLLLMMPKAAHGRCSNLSEKRRIESPKTASIPEPEVFYLCSYYSIFFVCFHLLLHRNAGLAFTQTNVMYDPPFCSKLLSYRPTSSYMSTYTILYSSLLFRLVLLSLVAWVISLSFFFSPFSWSRSRLCFVVGRIQLIHIRI